MNDQSNHQPTHRVASQRFGVTRRYRLGLAVFALGGMLLANTVVFARIPVANAMSTTHRELNRSRANTVEVVAQPTPLPTNTPTPTDAPALPPVSIGVTTTADISQAPVAFSVDWSSIPETVLPNTTFTLRGMAPPGSLVEVVTNTDYHPPYFYNSTTSDSDGNWYMNISVTTPGPYEFRLLARASTDVINGVMGLEIYFQIYVVTAPIPVLVIPTREPPITAASTTNNSPMDANGTTVIHTINADNATPTITAKSDEKQASTIFLPLVTR